MENGSKHNDLGEMCLGMIKDRYSLKRNDIGGDGYKKAKGMAFTTESWDVEGIGHLCIVRMKGFFGLMKMETAVFTVTGKDVPLINLDWVSAFGNETMLIEMYDDQLSPYPEEHLNAFSAIKNRDADIADSASSEHWYDNITYPCSYRKKDKNRSQRFNAAAADYFSTFLDQTDAMPSCDPAEKAKRAGSFAEKLYRNGGPAVDQVKKLFGDEFAERLVLGYMYGVAAAE